MKNKVICLILALTLSATVLTGCGQDSEDSSLTQAQTTIDEKATEKEIEETPQSADASTEETDTSTSNSLDDELMQVEAKAEEIYATLSDDCTQLDMNLVSGEVYQLWDDELNSLWARFSDNAAPDLKAKVLDEQRHWIREKELRIKLAGLSCYMGSMQPLMESEKGVDLTKARCYELAQYISEITDLSFTLDIPVVGKDGLMFVDTQGTTDIYSELLMDADYIEESTIYYVEISLYRLATLNGEAEKISDTEFAFESYEHDIKGTITISSGSAKFEVTESANGLLNVGEVFEFPEAF